MRLLKTVLCIFSILPLSGCFIFEGYKNWAEGVGTHLPVKEDRARCEGQMTCFDKNTDNNTATPAKAPAPPPAQPVQKKPAAPSQKTSDKNADVPAWMKEESRGTEEMKPWEQNPPWKKDQPDSPIDQLKEGLDW